MGEREFKNFTICYQDENGEMKPLTSWDSSINGLSLAIESDEEQTEALKNTVNNTNVTLDFSSVICSDDFTYLLEVPETHYEFSEKLKEELKEISRKESQKVIDEKTEFWCQAFLDFINGKNPFDQKSHQNTTNAVSEITEDSKITHTTDSPATIEELIKNIEKNNNIDSLDSLGYALEEVGRLAGKCACNLEKFAESLKLVYNEEKEKKGEEMKKKSTFALPIIGVRFQGSTKTYAYFVTKEVLETYFEYMRDCRNVTKDCLPLVTIQNESGYNYKNSKVKFIGLAKTPMMLNCPTHIITRIYDTFSYAVSQEDDDFCPFEKCNLTEEDWFEKVTIYPIPKTLCDEFFNSKYWKITDMDFSTLKTYNDTDEAKIENIKGDNKMNFNKIFPNAEIGKATDVKMSIYGPAFCTADKREIAFKDGEWTDVSGFTFDLYPGFVCPVKVADIVVGDFIKHLGTWCRVIGINDTTIMAENVYAREVITILPTKSMFGFDFYSKLIIPFGDVTANIGDMFSNPFMTMMLFGSDSKDFNNLLPLMLMNGGKFDMSNPMMLYFLMKENKTDGINLNLGF